MTRFPFAEPSAHYHHKSSAAVTTVTLNAGYGGGILRLPPDTAFALRATARVRKAGKVAPSLARNERAALYSA